jgi:rhamnosyltransferase
MKIGALYITFNPELLLFENSLRSLSCQVDYLLIVDNNSINRDEIVCIVKEIINCSLIMLNDNKGIATATNIGLNYYAKGNYSYVVISDQDTLYPYGYIKKFYTNYNIIKREYTIDKIAAFVPIFYDNVANNMEAFFIKSKVFYKKIFPKKNYTEIYQAIISGMIMNLNVIKIVGGMNDLLFIDWVDFEWCWKINFHNYKIIGCKNMCITHNLGNVTKNISFRNVNLRTYSRHYYITRNAFYLSLYSKYLNFSMKIILFFKSFQYILGYTILSKDHFTNFNYCLCGMFDGILKNMGPCRIKDHGI